LSVPIWLRVTAAGKKSALVAVPASESVVRKPPASAASAASPAQVTAPAYVVPSVPVKPPAPASAPLPASAPHSSAEEFRALAVAKRPETAIDVPVPVAKPDHLGLAREAFNTRDWVRALDEGKRAVTAGGGAEAHAVVGNTYYKMGRFAEAEQEYTKAVAIEPTNKLLRDRLSIARVRASEIKKGKEP
jgi:tetratricopeptide (TPR) repeat protein